MKTKNYFIHKKVILALHTKCYECDKLQLNYSSCRHFLHKNIMQSCCKIIYS